MLMNEEGMFAPRTTRRYQNDPGMASVDMDLLRAGSGQQAPVNQMRPPMPDMGQEGAPGQMAMMARFNPQMLQGMQQAPTQNFNMFQQFMNRMRQQQSPQLSNPMVSPFGAMGVPNTGMQNRMGGFV